MSKYSFLLILLMFVKGGFSSNGQKLIPYKQIDTTRLYLEVYVPEGFDKAGKLPALVFFFGGGWNSGDRSQFRNHAVYFSQKGMVCILADYRTRNKNNTTPFESLKDARSAMRFVRQNAAQLGVDPEKIVASGGSAGGHLAAATATAGGFDDPADDVTISCVPNAMVLYNPVIDNGPGGYGYERVGEAYKNFSPLHNLHHGVPPAIIFLGTKDHLIPVETVLYFQKVMERIGSRCDVKLYEGQGHGFFNSQHAEYYAKTVAETELFLQSLGYLPATLNK